MFALLPFLYLACGGGEISGVANQVTQVDPGPPGPASAIPVKPLYVVGHWYLTVDGERVTLVLQQSKEDGTLRGVVIAERPGATAADVDRLSYNATDGSLVFRVPEGGQAPWGWYQIEARDGIATGRVARIAADVRPTDYLAYDRQLIGWQEETFGQDIVPRVFDLTIDGKTRAILRIDEDSPARAINHDDAGSAGPRRQFIGQLKVYATSGLADEQLAETVAISRWDGRSLEFTRMAKSPSELFSGSVSGRLLSGTIANGSDPARAWTGERAEVLTHGFGRRSAAWMSDWQLRTRARLARLAMAGNPRPLATSVRTVATRAPIPHEAIVNGRDDSSDRWPQNYQLHELAFSFTLPNPAGGAPLVRQAHGFMAVPNTPPPAGGYPVAVALNGHWGSAQWTFEPQNNNWYGDAFARRGYLVVAIDLSHRPVADRAKLYTDSERGDDPDTGNGTHPAIKIPGLASEWEEDGERVWDAMRALDHALSRPDVNARRVTVVGLSMGGAISDWFGAMDVRVMSVVAAGSPPDLAAMNYKGNHPCWGWQRGNIREFVEPGDLHALLAPRTLVLETGAADPCYSTLSASFASAKQVVQRSRPAFEALGGKFIHYLHYDGHTFHAGETHPTGAFLGVTTPMRENPTPSTFWSGAWQTDGETTRLADSLFSQLP